MVHTLLSTKLVSDDAKILRLCWHAIHLAAVGLVARWITPEKRLVEIKANLRDVRYLTSDRSATRFSARSRSKDPANYIEIGKGDLKVGCRCGYLIVRMGPYHPSVELLMKSLVDARSNHETGSAR